MSLISQWVKRGLPRLPNELLSLQDQPTPSHKFSSSQGDRGWVCLEKSCIICGASRFDSDRASVRIILGVENYRSPGGRGHRVAVVHLPKTP